MVLPNQVCLIVKLYNNRPELLPDSNDKMILFKLYCMIRDNEDLLFKEWSNHLVESRDYSQQEVLDLFCPDGLHMTGNPIRTNNDAWIIMPDNQEEELWNHSKIR